MIKSNELRIGNYLIDSKVSINKNETAEELTIKE